MNLDRTALYAQLREFFEIGKISILPSIEQVQAALRDMIEIVQGDSAIFYRLKEKELSICYCTKNIPNSLVEGFNPITQAKMVDTDVEGYLDGIRPELITRKGLKSLLIPVQSASQTKELLGTIQIFLDKVNVGKSDLQLLNRSATIFGSFSQAIDIIKVLENSVEIYRSFINTFWDPVFILDSNLRIIEINSKLCEMTGRSRSEIIGQSPSLVLSKIVGEFPIKGNVRLIPSKQMQEKILYDKLETITGIQIPVEMTIIPFQMGVESNWFLFIYMRNISHRVHLKNQLRAAKEYSVQTKQIGTVVYHQTDFGPSTWYRDDLPWIKGADTTNKDFENELLRIGLILTTALGQGGAYPEGIYELPVAEYEYITVCYTMKVKDETVSDQRMDHTTYLIIATFVPKQLRTFIPALVTIEKRFDEILKTIKSIKEVDAELIRNLQQILLQLDD
ncbi:MAG: PAS domain-containing protein [Candidatus Hodarchaeales archaeon]|jgi:PAS domain S-box-containing protein